jgi:hypothetical protein
VCLHAYTQAYLDVCVLDGVHGFVFVCACVRACVRACVCVCACAYGELAVKGRKLSKRENSK